MSSPVEKCLCHDGTRGRSQATADRLVWVSWRPGHGTNVRCLHRGAELLAEATPATARRLRQIADHIAQSFRVLLGRFCALDGVSLGKQIRLAAPLEQIAAELEAAAPKRLGR